MPIKTSVFLFLLFFSSVVAQVEQGTGLEVENYREVTVVVETLGPDAASIGLTSERIKNRAELRLRGAGLTLIDLSLGGYLYVNINIVGNAFSILIGFERLIYYQVNDQVYLTSARTWISGGAGTHGESATYILDAIDEYLEGFLIEYLRANQ